MPKTKLWPVPLTKGTPVRVSGTVPLNVPGWGWRGEVGVIASSERWDRTWAYRIKFGENIVSDPITARHVQPLDMTNPDDLEAWLDEE